MELAEVKNKNLNIERIEGLNRLKKVETDTNANEKEAKPEKKFPEKLPLVKSKKIRKGFLK